MIGYRKQDAVLLWPDGDYEAVVSTCQEKRSKAGNDMYEVGFTVYSGEREIQVTDYIVLPKFTWKLKKLAAAVGEEAKFEAESFDPHDLAGRSANLIVTLGSQKQEGYDEKNVIKAYKKRTAEAVLAPPPDDGLPF
jgi:hypothetical protein